MSAANRHELALRALERAATAHMLARTATEIARTDALLLEAIEAARETLGDDAADE